MSVTEGRGNPPDAGTPAGWVEPELATLTHEPFSDPGWLYVVIAKRADAPYRPGRDWLKFKCENSQEFVIDKDPAAVTREVAR